MTNNIKKELPESIRFDRERWKNRRKLAYISLYAILFVMGVSLFVVPEPKLNALADIISTFFFVMASIIGTYIGAATLDDKWNKKKDDEK